MWQLLPIILTEIVIGFAPYVRPTSVPMWTQPVAKSSKMTCALSMLLKTCMLTPECSQQSPIMLFVDGHQFNISSTLISSTMQTRPETQLLDGASIWYAAVIFKVSCSIVGNVWEAWIEVKQCCRVMDSPGMPSAACTNSATHVPPSQ